MFTGIVVAKGKIEKVIEKPKYTLRISCPEIVPELSLGDSIAVDGVCLSTTKIKRFFFETELSRETLNKTSFLFRRQEVPVNLELPIRLSDRLGGHLVQGHVDTTVKFIKKKQDGEFADLFFELPRSLKRYLIPKGSVTLNGVSLTVSHLFEESFGVSLIPITLQKTNFQNLLPEDPINLESDCVAKYLESFLKHPKLSS